MNARRIIASTTLVLALVAAPMAAAPAFAGVPASTSTTIVPSAPKSSGGKTCTTYTLKWRWGGVITRWTTCR